MDFPQELIEYIVDFLWGDRPTLLSCHCTSPAWRRAAQYHLRGLHIPTITGYRKLAFVSHILSSKTTRWIYRYTSSLSIRDDPQRPFVRCFPLHIPGSFLPPTMEELYIAEFDWGVHRPHDSFFTFLSHYTSIRTLGLENCCLHSAGELDRLIRSLPHLERLILSNIVIESTPLQPIALPQARQHVLKTVVLQDLTDTPSWPRWLSPAYRTYSSVTSLALVHQKYGYSLRETQRMVQVFPGLAILEIFDRSGCGWSYRSGQSETPASCPEAFSLSLTKLVINFGSPVFTSEIMEWLIRTPSCTTLNEIELGNCSLEHPESFDSLLWRLGPILKTLLWDVATPDAGKYYEQIPVKSV